MRLPKKDFLDKPVIALLAANTMPLFGVLFLDWDVFFIVLIYWSENLAIGFFNILKMVFVPFFAIHYGGFTAGHGLLVFFIFYKFSGCLWEEAIRLLEMTIAVLALFISHGISFVYNYLHKREFTSANLFKLMFSPYGRVVVMHIAILGGGILIMTINSPAAFLLVFVVLKTFLDLTLHLRSHKKAQTNIPK